MIPAIEHGERPVASRRGRIARAAPAIAIALLAALAVGFAFLKPPSLPMPVMRDFEAYYAAGRLWQNGIDPYSTRIWSVERTLPGVDLDREELLPFVGPPVSLPLWALLARLPYPWAAGIWAIVGAASALLIVLGALAIATPRRRINASDAVAAITLCAACGPMVNGLSLGQASIPAAALIVAGAWLAARARPGAIGIGAFACAALKPNLALVLAGAVGSRRALISLAVGAAAFFAASAAVLHGPQELVRYLAVVRGQTAAEQFNALQFTVGSIAYGLGAPPTIALRAETIVAVLVVILAAATIRWARATSVEAIAIAAAAFPFVAPFLHEHDRAVVLLPALIAVRRGVGPAWLAGAFGTVLLAVDWLGLTQGTLGALYVGVVTIVTALIVAALNERHRLVVRLAPLSTVILVAVLGLTWHGHTMPLWPMTLPPHFSAPANASATEVWALEQRASGLDARHPREALLRAISLGGCALVWFAIATTARRESREREPAAEISGDQM